jgi:hypothetical protein
MTYEGNPGANPEKKPVSMSQADWEFVSAEVNSEDDFLGSEIESLLHTYGIKLNSGMIEVEIDGKLYTMDTNKNNFGVLDPSPSWFD